MDAIDPVIRLKIPSAGEDMNLMASSGQSFGYL
jgi:hypothetical protein